MIIASIYCIRNKRTNARYVGQSTHVLARVRGHFQALREGKSKHPRLQADYDTHGPRAFVAELLELLPNGLNRIEAINWLNAKEKEHDAKSVIRLNAAPSPGPVPAHYRLVGNAIVSGDTDP